MNFNKSVISASAMGLALLGATAIYPLAAQAQNQWQGQGNLQNQNQWGQGNQQGQQDQQECRSMNDALNRLISAQNALNDASHDFAGHRKMALGDVNQAINQVKLGLRQKRCQ